MSLQKCFGCRFFVRRTAVVTDPGECRAGPPTASLVPGSGGKLVPVGAWPPVRGEDGCGSGEPRVDPVQVFNVSASKVLNGGQG